MDKFYAYLTFNIYLTIKNNRIICSNKLFIYLCNYISMFLYYNIVYNNNLYIYKDVLKQNCLKT